MPKIAHPNERNNTRTTPFGAISGQGHHSGPAQQPRRTVYTSMIALDAGRIGVAASAGEFDKPDQNGKRVSVTQNGKTFSADTEPPSNTVSDRVYEIIDDLSGKAGKPVWFAQKELAEFLGVTPQTLSLAISELKADGLIGVTRMGKKFSYTAVRTETQLPMIAAITAHRSRTESIAADMPPNAVPANDDNHEESTKTKPTASATACEDDLKSTISTDEVPPKQPESPPETQHDDGMRIQQSHRKKSRKNPQSSGKSTTLKPINSKNTEVDEIWRKAMMGIKLSLPSDLYDSFMAPTAALSLTESEITIATQSNFAREWLMLPLHHTIAVESVRACLRSFQD